MNEFTLKAIAKRLNDIGVKNLKITKSGKRFYYIGIVYEYKEKTYACERAITETTEGVTVEEVCEDIRDRIKHLNEEIEKYLYQGYSVERNKYKNVFMSNAGIFMLNQIYLMHKMLGRSYKETGETTSNIKSIIRQYEQEGKTNLQILDKMKEIYVLKEGDNAGVIINE